jgi:hypothetical protein
MIGEQRLKNVLRLIRRLCQRDEVLVSAKVDATPTPPAREAAVVGARGHAAIIAETVPRGTPTRGYLF